MTQFATKRKEKISPKGNKRTSSAEQYKTKTIQDIERECADHMFDNGFENVSLPLDYSTNLVKFNGRGDDSRKTEWYKADEKEDGTIIVTYNSHHDTLKKDEHYVFHSKRSTPTDPKEREAKKKRVQKRQEERKQEQELEEKKRLKQAEKDRARFNAASETGVSPYLERKQVKAHGVRFENNILLVPMIDSNGQIQCLQELLPEKILFPGEKKPRDKNFTNAMKGLYHPIGKIKDGEEIRVSEGYSTADTIFDCTEQIIPHVVAFSAGNYQHVIPVLKKLYPNSLITICADNNLHKDQTKRNVGREEAYKMAKEYNCRVVFPTFPEGKQYDNADFNDLMILEGAQAVKQQIENNKPQHDENAINTIKIITIQNELRNLELFKKEEPCGNFSTKELPKVLAEYIESICETTEAHKIMITSSVISSLSGIVKKRLFIPKGEYFQKLYPNLWMINLYKSGGFKSTAMENGASIARGISASVQQKMFAIDEQIRTSKKEQKIELENQKLKYSLEDVILPNKITSEALLEHLSQGHAGVILTGEFGAWLQNMEKAANGDLKGIFTELYDVPPSYRYKTKGQGDHILREPFFSICGVSTLSWLKDNLKPNDVSGGFFARFLLFTPPQQDYTPPALPKYKTISNHDAEIEVQDILTNMNTNYEYRLSNSARNFFEESHNNLYLMTKSYTDKCQETLDPYLKRWSPYILKLAMIMRLFEDPNSKEISDTAINAAMSIIIPSIKSTACLFEGELGESEHQRKCRTLFDWVCMRFIKGKKPITWKEIITSKKFEGGSGEYEYVCKTLEESGKLIVNLKCPKMESLYVPVIQ